jgi:hypothetical protein
MNDNSSEHSIAGDWEFKLKKPRMVRKCHIPRPNVLAALKFIHSRGHRFLERVLHGLTAVAALKEGR